MVHGGQLQYLLLVQVPFADFALSQTQLLLKSYLSGSPRGVLEAALLFCLHHGGNLSCGCLSCWAF